MDSDIVDIDMDMDIDIDFALSQDRNAENLGNIEELVSVIDVDEEFQEEIDEIVVGIFRVFFNQSR